MYLDFFGFNSEPFHVTPDPEFLFLSPSHKEALAAITYGVERRAGFIEIVGDVGLGKTTILRSYLAGADKDGFRPVVIFNPNISFRELLKAIYEQLDWELPATGELSALVDQFHVSLVEEYKQDRNIVVIIDEAQNMPLETLEQLRLLSNLESSKDKLIQILLVGQPELDRILNLNELRQLRQRITLRATLSPLTATESAEYINYRLSKVATSKVSTGKDPVFTKAAMRRIVKYCEGIPRKINIVCDNACITAYGYQKKPVSRKIVNEVIGDLYGGSKRKRQLWMPLVPAAGLVLLAAFWLLPPWSTIVSSFPKLESESSSIQSHISPRPGELTKDTIKPKDITSASSIPATRPGEPAKDTIAPKTDDGFKTHASVPAPPASTPSGELPSIETRAPDVRENMSETESMSEDASSGQSKDRVEVEAVSGDTMPSRVEPTPESEEKVVLEEQKPQTRPVLSSAPVEEKKPAPESSRRQPEPETKVSTIKQPGSEPSDLTEVIDKLIQKREKR